MSKIMPETHRERVAKNPYQGTFKRVLCVCSGGVLRSPTLAWMLSNPPYNRNTRCAGSEDYALVPVDQVLLDWADELVFLGMSNLHEVSRKFLVNTRVFVLNVPDRFAYRDPELIVEIGAALKREKFAEDAR